MKTHRPTSKRTAIAWRFAVLLAAGTLIAACQQTTRATTTQGTTAGASYAQPGGGLNKDWGSCALRHCGKGK